MEDVVGAVGAMVVGPTMVIVVVENGRDRQEQRLDRSGELVVIGVLGVVEDRLPHQMVAYLVLHG